MNNSIRVRKVVKHELVPVVIDNIQKKVFDFPYRHVLQGKTILGVESYADDGALSLANAPDGADLIGINVAAACFLTFTDCNSVQVIRQIPYQALILRQGDVQFPPRFFKERQFDIERCKVIVGDTSLLVLNEVFLFSFYYED